MIPMKLTKQSRNYHLFVGIALIVVAVVKIFDNFRAETTCSTVAQKNIISQREVTTKQEKIVKNLLNYSNIKTKKIDFLGQLSENRNRFRGISYKNVMVNGGGYDCSILVEYNLTKKEIYIANKVFEDLHNHIAHVMSQSLLVVNREKNEYIVSAYYQDLHQYFNDAYKELENSMGFIKAEQVLSNFPLEAYAGFCGQQETTLQFYLAETSNFASLRVKESSKIVSEHLKYTTTFSGDSSYVNKSKFYLCGLSVKLVNNTIKIDPEN